jgi:hypothetical protein
MPFTPPQFNNSLDRWNNPRTPAGGPPDFINNPYQIYTWSKQINYWFDSTTGKYAPTIIIREPAAPPQGFVQPGDILGKDLPAFTDFPLLYLCLFKNVIHSGFPNKYQQLVCVICNRNGAVIFQPRP